MLDENAQLSVPKVFHYYIPLQKGGDTTELGNFRPVTILPVISKVIKKLAAIQLTEHFNIGEHPSNQVQLGFGK